jgi:uncharacterized protein YfiM (DUF2279 family)
MRVIVPLWLALLAALSLAPDHWKDRVGVKGSFHGAAHLAVFATTAVIFCWTANSLRSRLLRAFGACLIALLMEWLEAFFYENSIEWRDVWTGCLGVALGFAITVVVQLTRKRPGRSVAIVRD